MGGMVQQSLVGLPVQRLDDQGEGLIKRVDGDLDLVTAKAVVSQVYTTALLRSGLGLKHFGDPGQVARQLHCRENQDLPRYLASSLFRREFVEALGEACDDVIVQTVLVLPRRHHR
jgi:hypothetical protein